MLLFRRKLHIVRINDRLPLHYKSLFLLYSLYSNQQETKYPFDDKYSLPILLLPKKLPV